MKSIYVSYAVGILAIVAFLGILGAVLVWGGLGFGVKAYIEATRYMSVPGKVAFVLLTLSVFTFVIKFATSRGR